jgi:hypothetical protein
MRWRTVLLVVLAAAAVVALPELALAGPGGRIASAVANTFWGRVLLGVLAVIFLPVIVYVVGQEWLAERRVHRALQQLRAAHPAFDWLRLKDRVVECFHRVHSAWRKEDMAQAAAWMTDWYWQNQQLAHLDRWAEQGLVNHCSVKGVGRVRPLHIACRNADGDFSGTRLVVAVHAKMEDYLAERASGKVVEGRKGYHDVETVWTLELGAAGWRVAAIEEDSLTLAYARLANELPEMAAPAAAAR